MKRIVKTSLSILCCVAAMTAMPSCAEKPTDGTEAVGDENEQNNSDKENGGAETSFESVITELHCKSQNIDIYGLMYTPKGKEGKLPVVVLSHSSSLTHEAMVPYAEYLVKKGYAAYCFDFCGACDESLSKGRTTEEMTVFTEVDDLGIVLDKIRTLDYIDLDNVFVLGSSQGGLVTALVAEKRPSDIKGMILFYPAFNLPELVAKFTSDDGGILGGILSGIGSGGNMGMSDAFVNSVKDFDVYANIGKYPGDIIILHGTKDFLADIKYSEQAVEKYPSAILYPIEGASHGFNNENLKGMASMVGGEKDDVVMPYVYDYLANQIS